MKKLEPYLIILWGVCALALLSIGLAASSVLTTTLCIIFIKTISRERLLRLSKYVCSRKLTIIALAGAYVAWGMLTVSIWKQLLLPLYWATVIMVAFSRIYALQLIFRHRVKLESNSTNIIE
jgi:hypothetical protein